MSKVKVFGRCKDCGKPIEAKYTKPRCFYCYQQWIDSKLDEGERL